MMAWIQNAWTVDLQELQIHMDPVNCRNTFTNFD